MQLLLRVMQVLELIVHVLMALQLTLRVTFSMVLRHGLLLALQLRLPMMVLMVHPMILSCCCPGCNLSKLDFNQAAEEAGMSRIYGGIHFRADNLDGLKLGRSVAVQVLRPLTSIQLLALL